MHFVSPCILIISSNQSERPILDSLQTFIPLNLNYSQVHTNLTICTYVSRKFLYCTRPVYLTHKSRTKKRERIKLNCIFHILRLWNGDATGLVPMGNTGVCDVKSVPESINSARAVEIPSDVEPAHNKQATRGNQSMAMLNYRHLKENFTSFRSYLNRTYFAVAFCPNYGLKNTSCSNAGIMRTTLAWYYIRLFSTINRCTYIVLKLQFYTVQTVGQNCNLLFSSSIAIDL